jgi:RNA polymerase sigma factor (sigma-70 family)
MFSKSEAEPEEKATEAASNNEQLAVAIASGNREAEELFVQRYLPRVRAMLLARTRNPELTADLQQDVMLEAICALRRGQLREAAKLPAFVLGIARNLLSNHFENAARQPVFLERPDDLPDLTNATDELADRQQQALARRAIADLAQVDQSILHLTLVEGLKPGAIAERLRLSPDVVRQRKVRATRKIAAFFAGCHKTNPQPTLTKG